MPDIQCNAMEVLKLSSKIDESGQLNISLPINLSAGKVDLVVIVNPVTEKAASPTKTNYDFSDLAGKLSW
ncbi:MAG: hypothetical protein AAGF83_07710 [Cyanobacteria bacterium P01_G01_bin.67]